MITIQEKETTAVFEPGTLIYDGASTFSVKNVILVVDHIQTQDGCFSGVYLSSGTMSDGLSKSYKDWKSFTGKVILENE